MLGEFLHSFFFGAPAILAVFASYGMRTRAARAILFWGGLIFAVPIWMALLGMLACDGKILSGYSNCLGGSSVDGIFATVDPVLTTVVYAYILLGPPLAGLAWLIDWLGKRRAPA